jgi:hypothetical protein
MPLCIKASTGIPVLFIWFALAEASLRCRNCIGAVLEAQLKSFYFGVI